MPSPANPKAHRTRRRDSLRSRWTLQVIQAWTSTPPIAITPCLWFDTEGEEAAKLYASVFPNSKILDVSRYGEAGPRPAGTVMTVSFELDGQKFLALNGGPQFTFSEAISFQVSCETQDEVDAFWSKLSEGGEEGPCGWLKDRFGLSWPSFRPPFPSCSAIRTGRSRSASWQQC